MTASSSTVASPTAATPRHRPRPATLLGLWLLAACGGQPAAADATASPNAVVEAPAGPHRIVVFATASLRRPFTSMAQRYEQDHPGAKVELRFDGGNQLLAAMNSGEPCDVIAIGDSSLMSRFAAAVHLASHSAAELARSRIAIVVAAGNEKRVTGLTDFGRKELRVALGTRSSSIGRHAYWALSRLRIEPQPQFQENHADGVLDRVAAGEADCGIVYTTSFVGAPRSVERIDVPAADNTPVLYSISVARLAAEPRGAAAFRALALGPVGQQILRDSGFLPIGAKL